MMNTSDERITGLSDEALNVPIKQALNCAWLCGISDEALDAAPAHEAAACIFCGPCACGISDEALEVPHSHALTCTIGLGVCIGNCARSHD